MPTEPLRYEPGQAEIENLLRAAEQHPLGADYLLNGHLGTVAITFGCHAFTVVAARNQLTADTAARKAS